jgi:hypothetical protein
MANFNINLKAKNEKVIKSKYYQLLKHKEY